MSKKGMLKGLLAIGIPLAGLWAKRRIERNKSTHKGSFGGYSFTMRKDE